MSPRPARPALPPGLVLDAEQQVEYDEMSRREQATFNGLADNPSRLAYIQGHVDKKRAEMEKSVCLIKKRYILLQIFTKIFLANLSLPFTAFRSMN